MLAEQCPKLEVLKISNAGQVTDIGVAALALLRCLKLLDITNCRLVTADAAEAARRGGLVEVYSGC